MSTSPLSIDVYVARMRPYTYHRVTHAEGPSVMLSQDLQDGIASLQREGPGHATFNNR